MEKPITNCHVHIFNSEHVPPYIAKKFLWWPFYLLLHLPTIIALYRFSMRVRSLWYNPRFIRVRLLRYLYKVTFFRNFLVTALRYGVGLWLTVVTFFILFKWVSTLTPPENSTILQYINNTYSALRPVIPDTNVLLDVSIVIVTLLFIKMGRNFIFYILSKVWKFFGLLPGKKTKELISRYIQIARFALYRGQTGIFSKLKGQYPEGTKFVVLSMDMSYMKAGKVKSDYYNQLADLKSLKEKNPEIFHPFIFVDPRRIIEDSSFFGYSIDATGNVVLDPDCIINEYINVHKFDGFKIYPALGYYPFDEALLPLWKYAADNGIPIMTHCISGVIYYRGTKKTEWDYHPVFKQNTGDGSYEPLMLPQKRNEDFSINFTHPLNYLCLLDERLLREVVSKSSLAVQELFGFTHIDTPLKHNLSNLKICLAHFGGEEEWKRFLESDRSQYFHEFNNHPLRGINLSHNSQGLFSWDKLEASWKFIDWYAIICSMMLQYPNVYADVSYILYTHSILPLLRRTIQNQQLGAKVLFGTDFYVVRNHNSDFELTTNLVGGLTKSEFDIISRDNPTSYLA